MKSIYQLAWKIIRIGGWFPLLVFALHLLLQEVFFIYETYPNIDIPEHFFGGVSIAYFVSQCFQRLPRESLKKSRVAILEATLIISLTTCTAVCWEFAEFFADRIFHSNLQVSLANTMQDLVLGMSGAGIVATVRFHKARAGLRELREFMFDWRSGLTAQ